MRFTKNEYDECVLLVEYLEILTSQGNDIIYSHIAHSTWTSSMQQKIKNKALGLKPGVPDYLILINNHPLFIEMKREKGSTTSNHQKKWIDKLNKCGIRSYICRGFNESKILIDGFLKLEKDTSYEANVKRSEIKNGFVFSK